MSWAEVSKVNGDFLNVPLDVKMHLADYKMHGKKSYVYQIKDLLHGIYECTYISMNDQDINGEALDYLLKNNRHAGEMLTQIADLEQKDLFKTLRAIAAVANSTTAMTAVLNSTTAMTAVANSTTAMTAVLNSTTAMTAVLNSTTAMTAVLNSTTAMTAVANSTTAMTAVLNSTTAMTAVANSTTAMTAVLNSTTAMTAVLNSTTAMTAVANSTTAMTAVLNSDETVKKFVNSPLIREVKLTGDTWNYPPQTTPVKGIIISFYCSDTNNALTVRKIDDMVVTDRNDDRNAADAGKREWKIWLARYSKNPAYNVMKKSITVAAHYANCAMRYIPIN